MKPGAVYSEQAQCQDCYKCVRACPVKAIRVSAAHAVVVPELCIACGACVSACPSGAKRVRDDLEGVEALLKGKRPVVVSLAPSFRSEFEGVEPGQLIAALRRLGFTAVSETALGAEQVSARLAQDLNKSKGKLWISTACPVAVDLICKFLPERVQDLTPIASPLQVHARLLKELFGDEVAVVFIGPCIAKKLEVEASPEPLHAALTFEELRHWMSREGLDPAKLKPAREDTFVPGPASEGALYPMEGGMAQATALSLKKQDTRFISLSGVAHIRRALEDLPSPGNQNIFLEVLACEGGCVCGPKALRMAPVRARMKILDTVPSLPPVYPRRPTTPAGRQFARADQPRLQFPEARMLETLQQLGKRGVEDELNCGACGYDTCRDLASAILTERAETRMCVSNMRRLAEKKANALLRTMPFGVVVVDAELRIIESNDQFVKLLGEDAWLVHQSQPGLAGASLEKCLTFAERFRQVLTSGDEIIREDIQSAGLILSTTIFTVEPHRVVGALLHDVTDTQQRHRQIIEKAEAVIQNTLANAQEIAFSLGKNAARSEGILNSIIAEFAGQEGRSGDGSRR